MTPAAHHKPASLSEAERAAIAAFYASGRAPNVIPPNVSGIPAYDPNVKMGNGMKRMNNQEYRNWQRGERLKAADKKTPKRNTEAAHKQLAELHAARREKIRAFAANRTIREIADFLGIKPKSAAHYCRRNGIEWTKTQEAIAA